MEDLQIPETKCTMTFNCRTLSPKKCKGFLPTKDNENLCYFKYRGKCNNTIERVQLMVNELQRLTGKQVKL